MVNRVTLASEPNTYTDYQLGDLFYHERGEQSGKSSWNSLSGAILALLPKKPLFPQDFGAVGDGVADDTAAISAMFGAAVDGSAIYFPAGKYLCNTGAITATGKNLAIFGDGASVSIIKPQNAGVAMEFEVYDGAVQKHVTISSLGMEPGTEGTQTAFKVTNAKTGVNGGFDALTLTNVRLVTRDTNYFQIGLHTFNCGGVKAANVSIHNVLDAAQNDTSTKGVFIETTAGVNVIRAFIMTNFWLARFYRAIDVNAEGTVESLYLAQGEIVGTLDGVYKAGSANLGAVHLDGLHMDTLGRCLHGVTTMNLVRLTANDFRQTANGGTPVGSPIVEFAAGETYTITGNQFSGNNIAVPEQEWKGLVIRAEASRLNISDNIFRNLDIGIEDSASNRNPEDIVVGENNFHFVTTPATGAAQNRVYTWLHPDGVTADGTSFVIDFDGIPSWATEIVLAAEGLQWSASAATRFQLITSAAVTAGYTGQASTIGGSNITGEVNLSGGFDAWGMSSPASIQGKLLRPFGNNIWTGVVQSTETVNGAYTIGQVDAGATVTGIRVTTDNGARTFDAGTINVGYR